MLVVLFTVIAAGTFEPSAPKIVNHVGERLADRTYHAPGEIYQLRIPSLQARETLTVSDRPAEPGITARVMIKANPQSDTLMLVAMFEAVQVPFQLRKVDGVWKVIPQKYFEMLRRADAL